MHSFILIINKEINLYKNDTIALKLVCKHRGKR
jgi:hypothetical protein